MFRLYSVIGGTVLFETLPRFGDTFADDFDVTAPEEFGRKAISNHAVEQHEFQATFTLSKTIRDALALFFTLNRGGPINVRYIDESATQVNTVMWIKEPSLEFRHMGDSPCPTWEVTLTFFKPTGGN